MEFIEKDWLKKMVEVSESDEKIGLVCCKLVYPDGSLQWYYQNGSLHFLKTAQITKETRDTYEIKEVEDVIGACVLIKKKVIDAIGFYDEGFTPLYGEDTDYCYRAGFKGYKLLYVGITKVMHWNGSWIKGMKNKNAEKRKWFLQKRHAIRLEWLNYRIPRILKMTIIHFGSAIISINLIRNLELLFKAYYQNIKNLKEIREKRRERFSWARKVHSK
jgi:GT2 family glycosyltransferase